LSMDFIVGLPLSEGFDAVLVVVCRITKMAKFIPTRTDIDATDLAYVYLREIFAKHGLPQDIVSDRDRLFISRFWQSLCSLLKIKSNLSTAYHPETDGQTERINQILEQYLRIYVNYQQDDWCSLLPLAEFAYNNATHSATGVTPFFANYGFHPSFGIDFHQVPSTKANLLARDFESLHSHLKEHLTSTIRRYAETTSDRRSPIPNLQVDDYCWLDSRNIKTKRPMKKLDHKRLGPFKIIEVVSTHARRLELPPKLRALHPVFHVSLLEPHTPNTIPNRILPPPPPVEVDENLEYEVDEILDSYIDKRRKKHGGLMYRVRWKGYQGIVEETNEPAEHLSNAPELTEEFHLRYPDKPRPP